MISSRFFELCRQFWVLNPLIHTEGFPVHEKLIELRFRDEESFLSFYINLDQRYENMLYTLSERGL